MKTSAKGISLIKEFESFRADAYVCPAGILTIGYGHTESVRRGQRVTPPEAELLLKEDLITAENAVNAANININQHQFDALVSFTFNVGTKAFAKSSLLKMIQKNPGNPAIRTEFLKWKHAGGKVLQGLVRRREAEANLYFETKLGISQL